MGKLLLVIPILGNQLVKLSPGIKLCSERSLQTCGIFKISDLGMNITGVSIVGKYFIDRKRGKEMYEYF